MGIIQRQSIQGLIYIGIGVVLGFLTTGLLMPRIFQTEEIGLLRVLISYANILSTLSILGFSVVSVKMFPFFRDQKTKHHGFFGLSLLVGLFGFIIASTIYLGLHNLILESGAEKSPLFSKFFYLIIPLTFFLMLYSVIDTYFRVMHLAVVGIIYKEVIKRILVLIVFCLFYLRLLDFTTNVYLYIIAFSLPTIFLFVILLKNGEYSLIPDFKFLKRPLLKKIGHVGLFGIFSSFSTILVINIDIIMLNHMTGLSETGIYSIAFFFGALVLIPSRSMLKISSVIIADAFKRKDLAEVNTIYKKSSINLGIIGMLILIGLWANMDNIFKMIGEDFRSGQKVILIIGFANLLQMLMGVSNQIFFNSKYYTTSAYLNFFFMLLLVGTNLIFIPIYGITGAAYASLLSKFLYNLFKYIFLLRKFHFQPFSANTIYLIILGVATSLIVNFLPEFPNYIIDIIFRSSLIALIFGFGVLKFKLSEDINIWGQKIADFLLKR